MQFYRHYYNPSTGYDEDDLSCVAETTKKLEKRRKQSENRVSSMNQDNT